MKTLLLLLALALTGCSTTDHKLAPPPYYLCDEPQQLLICDDETLTDCSGFLKDKPINIED